MPLAEEVAEAGDPRRLGVAPGISLTTLLHYLDLAPVQYVAHLSTAWGGAAPESMASWQLAQSLAISPDLIALPQTIVPE
jgi:hypothetical protein